MGPRPGWWARIIGGLIGIGLLLALPATAAEAGFLDLAWDAPTANADGTPLTDLAGYRVYWGTSAGSTTPPCNTNSTSVGNVTTFRLTGLAGGTTYSVRVTAVDTSGNESGCSNEATGLAQPDADTTSPTVSITSPTSNLTHSTGSSPLALGGAASDNVGVTQVTWANDRGGSGTASGTTSWTASGIVLQAGTNLLTVTARDAAENTATDTLTVTYTLPDTTPPTVSITAPVNNATVFGSSVTVSANASDNVGVAGVQFRLDGVNLGAEDTNPSYSVSWDTTTASNGVHTLTARARDAAGNTTTSSSVSVTVDNVTTASLTVRTLPGTRIFLGGNYAYLGVLQGTVPQTGEFQISGLTPGRHVLRTSMAGFMDAYRIVTRLPGSNVLILDLVLFDPLVTLNPTFTVLEAGAPILGSGGASVPFVVDWDNDGNKDLLLAGGDGSIALYQNVGTDAAPQFSGSTPIMADGTAIAVPGPSFDFLVDWYGDENKE